VRVTWIGHSTVLAELDGVRLLTDPVLRPRVMHLRRVASVNWEAVRAVDAVAVSHVHYDHLDPPSLRRLGQSFPLIVPRGAARMLRRRGFDQVVELEEGEETSFGALAIRATHAEHSARRGLFGDRSASLGYLVSGSSRLYFPGDTDLFQGMSELAPDLDVALLPVAGWGSRLPPGHLDPVRAAEALRLLRPRVAVPIHWGTYRRIGLSRDPDTLREPAESFARLAAELAPDVEVRVLPVGGALDFPDRGEDAAGIASDPGRSD
jgi:L-ascorbate metabolism protein UlaG (beta-lactamase superfamily)